MTQSRPRRMKIRHKAGSYFRANAMLALGLKTMKRPLRSPDGEAASMVQRDGFCNPRWEFRGHHCCGASLPTWPGRVGVRKKALVSSQRIDPITRKQPLKYFAEVLESPAVT